MTIYFAPLEGVTDVVYRRTHAACFTGVDKYFIPFVSPTHHLVFTPKEKRSVSPAENIGFKAVPQILSKYADQFLWAARELHDLGYEEVNLNLGCPSGTVTAKGKGSGMLRNLETLEAFLDENEYRIVKDDFFLVLPNQIHGYASKGTSKIWIGVFSEDYVREFIRIMKNKIGPSTHSPLSIRFPRNKPMFSRIFFLLPLPFSGIYLSAAHFSPP